MFTIEEICEEQEREYNQLMEEDDQYCHPESFKWGFEHGLDYALKKLGWHPASELPPLDEDGYSDEVIVIAAKDNDTYRHGPMIDKPSTSMIIDGEWDTPNVKWWCYPPNED